ncbi:M81 family metallopeptidase [Psychromarinibacter halotolerans]|uniref:Microcystinase C n=1 Tax=Psychromarinibacter halotolerans TaxID=1775175 RepID=A0ABV7GUN3_9RHOB|nr:M81 family metallopeptidase [Psychromarinibacter halotolerans]MDF0598504.1 M81 family metallopeptidase [Psychromarinibacter halotolerans]
MRLFTATLATESNTFAPVSTSLANFREYVFLRPGEHPDSEPMFCTAPTFVARQRAARDGFTAIDGSCFAASPGGVTNRADYEWMRDQILAELAAAMPLDAVMLGLHGAMVAHGYDDVEGDILDRVRAIIGPDCILGVEFDLHCHLSLKRVELCDVIVLYKEYPHTDVVDRAEELLDLILAKHRGDIAPVMSVYDCQQLGAYPTQDPVMREFVDWVIEKEKTDGVLSISVSHAYCYGDVPDLGGRVLVVTDGDKALADAVATEVGGRFQTLRGKTAIDFFEVEQGLDHAFAQAGGGKPIIVTDAADNAGAGAPSDNTTLIRALLARDAQDVAVGPVWDPVATQHCFSAGLGATFPLRFGGKTGPASGDPVDAVVEVIALARDCTQTFGPTKVALGDCAAIRIGGVEIVLNTARTQALGLETFTNLGIDPTARGVLVLKSSTHFRAAYAPIAAEIVHIHTDGLLERRDYTRIPYAKVRRPIWPLDEHASGGLIH